MVDALGGAMIEQEATGPVDDRCSNCGGHMRPPTRWEGLRRWFVNGGGTGRLYGCDGCGAMAGGGMLYRARVTSPLGRWLRLPVDVVHVLRSERTWHPVPSFYAIVMAASLVPAAGIVAAGGPPRRVLVGLPLLAWVGAFGWSLCTAFGRGRVGGEVIRLVAPGRAAHRDLDHQVEVARCAVALLPVLVPERWSGSVVIGGVGYGTDARGEPRPREIAVDAAASGDGSGPADVRLHVRLDAYDEAQLLREFAYEVEAADQPALDVDRLPADEVRRRLRRWHAEMDVRVERAVDDLQRRWEACGVLIDGERMPGHCVHLGSRAMTVLDVDGHQVTVTAPSSVMNDLDLARVRDAEPLIAEMRRQEEARLAL
jgi:hypothetical protein